MPNEATLADDLRTVRKSIARGSAMRVAVLWVRRADRVFAALDAAVAVEGHDSYIAWQAEPGRTQEEILALIDRAIEEADR